MCWLYEGHKKELSNQFKIQKRAVTEIVALKEENEKLKENMIKVPKGSMNYGYMKELEEENKKLKEEHQS